MAPRRECGCTITFSETTEPLHGVQTRAMAVPIRVSPVKTLIILAVVVISAPMTTVADSAVVTLAGAILEVEISVAAVTSEVVAEISNFAIPNLKTPESLAP